MILWHRGRWMFIVIGIQKSIWIILFLGGLATLPIVFTMGGPITGCGIKMFVWLISTGQAIMTLKQG